MSNQLYMDESNGNGVYATKSNLNTDNVNGGATTTTANNINMMNNGSSTATSNTSTTITTTTVGNLPASVSSEDLSQSLSEYTDADESISAPTEFLAEFLSAVMLKDYKKALKYCKLILQYEPNNATAKEFYPLILDKLRVAAAASDSDENYNKSSSPELELQLGECDEATSHHDSQPISSNSNNSEEEEQLSLSECEPLDDDDLDNVADDDDDDDVNIDDGDEDEDDVEDVDEDDEDEDDDDDDVDNDDDDDVMSSSGDDLPIDEQQDEGAVGGIPGVSHHGSGSSRNSSSGGGGGRSDNTTHSYSSLLLEEEDDDIVPATLQFCNRETTTTDLDVSNGNKAPPSASCSDSESPTEPLTQRLAAILRSKCGVSSNNDSNY